MGNTRLARARAVITLLPQHCMTGTHRESAGQTQLREQLVLVEKADLSSKHMAVLSLKTVILDLSRLFATHHSVSSWFS